MGLAAFGAIILVFLPAPVRCGVSLGFIIDDTGSMSDDISGVISKALELFDAATVGTTLIIMSSLCLMIQLLDQCLQQKMLMLQEILYKT
ncbi:hypothetical protein EB796_023570 [Bugula neritina]|uniref:Uncharacterized protein n=1 Tax=Bugula neritina TaxID=10212 RepID=A0A7J7IW40_BUGNE|nr:hypothetical protein EB796_023570 [Bugula neritina]